MQETQKNSVAQAQESLYQEALAARKQEAWARVLNLTTQCLALGPYPPAQVLQESVQDILDYFHKDWLNP